MKKRVVNKMMVNMESGRYSARQQEHFFIHMNPKFNRYMNRFLLSLSDVLKSLDNMIDATKKGGNNK